jgi:hypothetical protein
MEKRSKSGGDYGIDLWRFSVLPPVTNENVLPV